MQLILSTKKNELRTAIEARIDRSDLSCETVEVAGACLENQSTLIVPGAHSGMQGYIRFWFGGSREFILEGFRRIKAELAKL